MNGSEAAAFENALKREKPFEVSDEIEQASRSDRSTDFTSA